ncbi:hypothetical protein L2D14_02850 [Thalassospiraceae bacterium LMO-JJ14]|nr:hypothetical protein L2D14_02850 [Thalassospiraceae bacterium LMO-JJ14]
MLLDPMTFEALVEGLCGSDKAAKAAMSGIPALPDDEPLSLIAPEREQILLSFGLTERDLDYMGDAQRQMVDEVIDRVMAVYAFA